MVSGVWVCACSARNWERSEAISGVERPAERRASKPAGSVSDGAGCRGMEEDDAGTMEEKVKAIFSAASAEAESAEEAFIAQ